MTSWGVAQAKAKFSEVLDRVETEGPQLVRRRKREFVVLTREQCEALSRPTKKVAKGAPPAGQRTMSEFFRNSPLADFDIDFERIPLNPRHVDF